MPIIKLYGSENCHKTNYYKSLLEQEDLQYEFLDVEVNKHYADELRGLYVNGKLNFPTLTIGEKKLRNPTKEELIRWVNKLIPQRLTVVHNRATKEFTMDINGEQGSVSYEERDGKLYLTHSEIPYNLRGLGIGKVLVTKTFEKLTDEGFEAVAICSFVKAVARRSDKWNSIIN